MATQALSELVAAEALKDYFDEFEITFAFAGNLARSLYGDDHSTSRQRIEVFLFAPVTPIHDIKQGLANAHSAYFTYSLPSRTLYYRDSTNEVDAVEIALVSATFGTPRFLVFVKGFPLIPYTFLILRELMFWDTIPLLHKKNRNNRSSTILRMLSTLRKHSYLQHFREFDETMHAISRERVGRFFEQHPSFRKEWQRLGLIPHRERLNPSNDDSHAEEDSLEQDELPRMLESMIITPTLHPSLDASSTSTSRNVEPNPSTPEKPPKKPKVSRMQIRRLAARKTVDILRQHGFSCTLFGSMACKVYGNPRIPNDIDVLVLPLPHHTLDGSAPTQESLKALLVETAPSSFFLKPSRDPEADYKVLYFIPTPNSKRTPQHSTKVDILLPGVMHLPELPPSRVVWRMNNITYDGDLGEPGEAQTQTKVPTLPFSALLLHKLQSWDDHRHAEEAHHRAKVPQDVEDLEWMLEIGVPRYLRIDPDVGRFSKQQTRSKHPIRAAAEISLDMELCGEEFVLRSKERVGEFCDMYPKWRDVWNGLGFDVNTLSQRGAEAVDSV
ncbi:hypothetical protein H0H92_011976 [Tricholoma furcatifolium]|nr:hypothetical protein H0H92_011976 [Tricholoma furcatifolium]